ncbi:FtsX-like permease family protein [uncultured Flavobacterium sp.]|uniref:FtsX-like permease family protein n=1 Tax=uncultured Flavobacterium sp. TaxID=165435 RepID=UPI0025D11789|nr:FtsX-like permease family protein [uncultured Flavobacterium sp.]
MKKLTKFAFLYLGLFLAFALVLSCIQLYVNADAMFESKSSDANYWITLSKAITPDNIGRKELIGFNGSEIEELKKWEEVKDIYPVVSNDFKVSADGGDFIPFYTDMYLEAVDNAAIDIQDLSEFKVQDNTIPIVISREYLNLYNYGFALNQGLPQITEGFAKKIEVNINLRLKDKNLRYKGKLIGLSDRIHSVLVPKQFLDSINATQDFSKQHKDIFTRVLVKVNDASDQGLIEKMAAKGYESNQESLRSAKIKSKLFLVLNAIAFIGAFIFLLCLFIIINFIKMEFLEKQEEVSIKYSLGYSPRKMVSSISRHFSINVGIVMLLCLICVSVGQYYLASSDITNGLLSPYIWTSMWALALIVPLAVFIIVNLLIYRWLIRSWKF